MTPYYPQDKVQSPYCSSPVMIEFSLPSWPHCLILPLSIQHCSRDIEPFWVPGYTRCSLPGPAYLQLSFPVLILQALAYTLLDTFLKAQILVSCPLLFSHATLCKDQCAEFFPLLVGYKLLSSRGCSFTVSQDLEQSLAQSRNSLNDCCVDKWMKTKKKCAVTLRVKMALMAYYFHLFI